MTGGAVRDAGVVARSKAVHVLVGLIADGAGRWLVNQRKPGTHLAGAWEFPGGKLQAGESRFDALRRELNEELGIDVLEAEPLLELVHEYSDKTVHLDVWRVVAFRGEVHAREAQNLRWVQPREMAALPLLDADLPIINALLGPAAPTEASER